MIKHYTNMNYDYYILDDYNVQIKITLKNNEFKEIFKFTELYRRFDSKKEKLSGPSLGLEPGIQEIEYYEPFEERYRFDKNHFAEKEIKNNNLYAYIMCNTDYESLEKYERLIDFCFGYEPKETKTNSNGEIVW